VTTEITALEQLFADGLKLLHCTIEGQSEVVLSALRRDRLAAAVSAPYRLFNVQ
jgi:hypothetical protein